jgi:hypothetical protein
MSSYIAAMQTKGLGLFLGLLGVIASFSVRAEAAPLPRISVGELAGSEVSHALLSQRRALEAMSRYLGRAATAADIPEALAALREAHPSRYLQLETEIAQIQAELRKARAARNGGKEVGDEVPLTDGELAVFKIIDERELLAKVFKGAHDPVAGEIAFSGSRASGSFNARKSRLLSAKEEEEVLLGEAKPGELAPKEIQREARRSFKEWYEEGRSCVQTRPRAASAAADHKFMLESMAISALVTSGATLWQTGFSNFDPGRYSIDLSMSLLTTGIGTKVVRSQDGFRVRWLKGFSMGMLRNKADFELYQVAPWIHDKPGKTKEEIASETLMFNYAWTTKTGWVSPLVTSILNNVQCMLDKAAAPGMAGELVAARNAAMFSKFAFGTRLALSSGMSMYYMKSRANNAADHSTESRHGHPESSVNGGPAIP